MTDQAPAVGTLSAGERAFTAWAATSGADGTPLMWTWSEMPQPQQERWAKIALAAAPAVDGVDARKVLRRTFWRLSFDAVPAFDNPGDCKWRLSSTATRILADAALSALTVPASSDGGKCWVLQRNDFPHAVYATKEDADAVCAEERSKDRAWREENKHVADVTVFWNVYPATLTTPAVEAVPDAVENELIERLVEMHKLSIAVWDADREPGMGRVPALMALGDKAERLSDTLARAMLYVSYNRPPTPTASDKLREALAFYRDAWNSEPNGDTRIEGDAAGGTTEPADALLEDKGK